MIFIRLKIVNWKLYDTMETSDEPHHTTSSLQMASTMFWNSNELPLKFSLIIC